MWLWTFAQVDALTEYERIGKVLLEQEAAEIFESDEGEGILHETIQQADSADGSHGDSDTEDAEGKGDDEDEEANSDDDEAVESDAEDT